MDSVEVATSLVVGTDTEAGIELDSTTDDELDAAGVEAILEDSVGLEVALDPDAVGSRQEVVV